MLVYVKKYRTLPPWISLIWALPNLPTFQSFSTLKLSPNFSRKPQFFTHLKYHITKGETYLYLSFFCLLPKAQKVRENKEQAWKIFSTQQQSRETCFRLFSTQNQWQPSTSLQLQSTVHRLHLHLHHLCLCHQSCRFSQCGVLLQGLTVLDSQVRLLLFSRDFFFFRFWLFWLIYGTICRDTCVYEQWYQGGFQHWGRWSSMESFRYCSLIFSLLLFNEIVGFWR